MLGVGAEGLPKAIRALLAIAAMGVVGAVLAGCGDDEASDATTEPDTPAVEGDSDGHPAGASGSGPQRPAAKREKPGEVVEIRESEFGPILVDGADRTLYLFDKETGPASECYGACAEAWPPFLTEGEPRAARSAVDGLVGTTERDDGTTQVTYGGHPLYYYVDDPPGEVLCHNVEEFGGLWLVVTPEGDAVQ